MVVAAAALVGSAFVIVLGALGWGWRRGTLSESDREKVDREFERIVRRYDRGT